MNTKINIFKLVKTKKKLQERLTTFDGLEKNVNSRPIVSPLIASDIEKICQNIVLHVQDISGGNTQVYQMNLFFKLDYEGRLWLVLCTSVKVREKQYANHGEEEEDVKEGKKKETKEQILRRAISPVFKVAEYPDLEDVESVLKTLKMNNGSMVSRRSNNQKYCTCCLEENILYPVKMSHLFAWRDKNVKDELFLKLIKRIWGPGMLKHVNTAVTDKNFMNVETRFCDDCYLKSAKE